jgi:NADPH-dependent 2,4-dienoyl-CoA reductase/sulfur reductase-like enzyme
VSFKARRASRTPRRSSLTARTSKSARAGSSLGSSPAIPPIKGLASIPYQTNETVFDLTTCPKHLIVIGAGSIGLELAQAFRRLGAAITVLEAASALSHDDAECAEIVLGQLGREGLRLHTGVEVRGVNRARGKIQVVIANGVREETIEGSHLLLATGRRPNIDELALRAAGIKHGHAGITIDERLRNHEPPRLCNRRRAGGPPFPMRRTTTPDSWSAAPCFACARRLTTIRCPWLRTPTPSLPGRV